MEMSEKALAISIIAMQMSDIMEKSDASFADFYTYNLTGWLVIFPVELSAGYFKRKRVQLGEADLDIAWELANRLHGYRERSVR